MRSCGPAQASRGGLQAASLGGQVALSLPKEHLSPCVDVRLGILVARPELALPTFHDHRTLASGIGECTTPCLQ